jgi:hypothetical protein
MEPTFEAAVASLLGSGESSFAQDAAGREERTTDDAPFDAVEQARRLLAEADAFLRAGDLVGFGRTWELLRESLAGAQ